MVKLLPVDSKFPAVASSYQLIVPPVAVALRVMVPGPQFEAGVVPVILGMVMVVLAAISRMGSPGIPPYSTTYPFGWNDPLVAPVLDKSFQEPLIPTPDSVIWA
ncbi:hypothetical protein D3C85_1419060 [compost metagenome]